MALSVFIFLMLFRLKTRKANHSQIAPEFSFPHPVCSVAMMGTTRELRKPECDHCVDGQDIYDEFRN